MIVSRQDAAAPLGGPATRECRTGRDPLHPRPAEKLGHDPARGQAGSNGRTRASVARGKQKQPALRATAHLRAGQAILEAVLEAHADETWPSRVQNS